MRALLLNNNRFAFQMLVSLILIHSYNSLKKLELYHATAENTYGHKYR